MPTIAINDIISELTTHVNSRGIDSLSKLLPLMRFEGKPFSLDRHFQLEPIFRPKLARRTVFMCSRQVGKPHNVSASNILRGALRPNFHMLLCEPQFSQVEQLSNVVVKDMIHSAYIYPLLQDRTCTDNMLLRTLRNGSRIHFSHCGLDARRVRGISNISLCWWDEVADMELDIINIVAETMSAVRGGGIYEFSGTPRFTDNTLSLLYDQSSQGELHFKCEGCNKTNIAAKDHDIYKMIGKETCVCAKCGKPIDVRKGWYEFAYPDRRSTFEGYHVSQITHPLHVTDREKWFEILRKQRTYTKAAFDNEVLGVPSDESVKMLTRDDLVNASHGRINSLEVALETRKRYATIVIGVDWGGGGTTLQSFTTLAILGYLPTEKKIDVLYMERVPIGKSSMEEADLVMEMSKLFRVDAIAHDGTAAGKIREELLLQRGAKAQFTVVPFWYVWSPRQDMLRYHAPQPGFNSYYSLDKTRSLAMLIAAIKTCQVRVPTFDSAPDLFGDLMALGEDYREAEGMQQARRIITRMGAHPDDMAHSINFGCQALWYITKSVPDLAGV